jgi:uncharacterized protein YjiS (DUF1127 family)
MAQTVALSNTGFHFADAVASAFEAVRLHFARRSAYRQTFKELSNLDDRTLEDLGLNRLDLEEVAREEAIRATS